MRTIHTLLMAMATVSATAATQSVTVSDVNVERSASSLVVTMNLDATAMKLKSDREIKYIPVITNGTERRELPEVIIAGRNRYIQNQRHDTPEAPAILSRAGHTVSYSTIIPYEQWMEESRLVLVEDECDCGVLTLSSGQTSELASIDFVERVFAPQFVMVTPPAELEKTRSAKGSAYVDFPVNRTEISPTYRRNPEELAKIRSTIDVVANDPDSRITSVSIVGFASPEGSYANNERLAKGRSASLAEYVRGLYSFDADMMHTSWVAENWKDSATTWRHAASPTPQPSSPSSTTHLSLPTCANGGSNPSSRRTTHSSSKTYIPDSDVQTTPSTTWSAPSSQSKKSVRSWRPHPRSSASTKSMSWLTFLSLTPTPIARRLSLLSVCIPTTPLQISTWLPLHSVATSSMQQRAIWQRPETPLVPHMRVVSSLQSRATMPLPTPY
ncbi:DUF3868 domain-containing protein [Duncaniella dubosii]|uniref:DUF3868 domain-containing protein n=1 Tax=Duncaniella dubosii TaxID=2518971 RepID=A0A4P7W2U6_9BACT|nr:DUF3868 domain-containing protein [Duncaniella dubosii]QCD42306.1 DUF3868 domain-containing protein [Duncaniella dubosii]